MRVAGVVVRDDQRLVALQPQHLRLPSTARPISRLSGVSSLAQLSE